jgi:hypothetical protein
MKYYIAVVLLSLSMPALPQDIVFSGFTMGMSKEAVTALYPNLRSEKDDAWISLGNAVFTRCYIDPGEGLYRIESAMREEDQGFITAMEDTFTQRHGGPAVWEAGAVWSVDNHNIFDDPDTGLQEILRTAAERGEQKYTPATPLQ